MCANRQAAIDHQMRACDPGRMRASQVRDRRRHILWQSAPPQRVQCLRLVRYRFRIGDRGL